jgi:hypothetical protein
MPADPRFFPAEDPPVADAPAVPVLPRFERIMPRELEMPRFTVLRSAERIRAMQAAALSIEQQRRQMQITSTEAQLGAPLARTPEGDIADVQDLFLRVDVARSREIPAKVAKIQAAYPELDVRIIDDPLGGQLIAVEQAGTGEYLLLDSTDFFDVADAADAVGILGSAETLMSIVAAVRTRGASLLPRLGGQAAGGATGRAIDIGIEKARGFDERTVEEIATDVTISGALASIGELMFAPFRRVARATTRGGFVELTPEEIAVQRTALEMTEGGLTVGQVSPVVGRMEQQAAQTSKRVQQRHLQQVRDALADFQQTLKAIGNFDGLNDQALAQANRRIETAILRMANVGPVDPHAGGKALLQGRREYVTAVKEHLKRKYDRAIAASAGATLDIAEAVEIAASAKSGVRMKVKVTPATPKIPAGFAIVRAKVQKPGKPPSIRITIDPAGKLAQLIDRLIKLDPSVSMFEDVTAFEQVKALRTQFFDLKNAAMPGQENIENRIARQIWQALKEAMDSPAGGSEQFVALHAAASAANVRKELILDMVDLRRIAQTSALSADDLMRQIARPYNGASLRLLSRIMPRKQFEAFRQAYMADLTATPENMIARLDEFRADPRALRVLLSPNEEAALREAGRQWQRWQGAPFKRALEEISSAQRRAVEIVKTADVDELTSFIAAAGGKNSAQGQALRAGTIQSILDRATTLRKGVEILDIEVAIRLITDLNASGKLATIFNAAEVRFLLDRRAVLSFFKTTADPGASLRAQELVSQTTEILTAPVKAGGLASFLSGLTGLLRNAFIGRMLLNPTVRSFMVGGGRQQLDFTTLRALAAIMAESTQDIEGVSLEKRPLPAAVP